MIVAPWGMPFRPYVRANLIREWLSGDTTTFADTDTIETGGDVTSAEVGVGFAADITANVVLWGLFDYATEIAGGDNERETWRGNVSLRVIW